MKRALSSPSSSLLWSLVQSGLSIPILHCIAFYRNCLGSMDRALELELELDSSVPSSEKKSGHAMEHSDCSALLIWHHN